MQWMIVLFVVVVGASVLGIVGMGTFVAGSDDWTLSVWLELFGSAVVKLVKSTVISDPPEPSSEPSSGSPAVWGSDQGSGSLALIVS